MTNRDEEELDAAEFITGEWSSLPVRYNRRDLLLYAVGIGCAKDSRSGFDSNHRDLRFVYEQHEAFAAFPTYPVLLSQKGVTADIDTVASSDAYLGKRRQKRSGNKSKPRKTLAFKGVRAGVDAERYIERVRSLPTLDIPPMQVRSRLVGVHKKGSGALVESESELVDASGDVYYKFQHAGFRIGAHGFKGAGRTFSEKIVPPAREPDAVVELETTPEQAHMYRLSGDYNPLHIDPAAPAVRGGGFSAPILHGLCTLGHSARSVLLAFGENDPERFHAIKPVLACCAAVQCSLTVLSRAVAVRRLRFASPVIPGDVLVTKCWRLPKEESRKFKQPLVSNSDRIVFTTEVKSTKKIVIANAFMDVLRPPSSPPRSSKL